MGNESVCCSETFNTSLAEYANNSLETLSQTLEEEPVTESTSLFGAKNVEIVITNSSFQKSVVNDTLADVRVDPSGKPHQSGPQEANVGLCLHNEIIFSAEFTELYQKIYISFYIISLLAVFTLYFFIYRSVAERREWRRKQKSFSHSPMAVNSTVTAADNDKIAKDVFARDAEHLELAPQNCSASHSSSRENGGGNESDNAAESTAADLNKTKPEARALIKNCGHENGVDGSAAERKTNRERRDFNFLANIRTAIMLFVVALVFIISFLPSWLMATHLIEYEIVVFYMHFVYNVANPVIYAFMNQSFRKELKRVFQRGTHLLRGG